MSRLRSIFHHAIAATLGVATMAALANQWLPPGLMAAAFAVSFILLLPRKPWLVAAFCGGAALAVLSTWALWSMGSGWGCASEVNGAIVEHDCDDPPPQQGDAQATST